MKNVILSTILLIFNYSYSQSLTISGNVKTNSNKKLEYVNIGIKKKNVGTISNENGKFLITIDKSFLKDSLTFSYVGFKNLTIKIEDIKSRKLNEFILLEQSTELNEVVISTRKRKIRKLGTKSYVSMVAGYLWSRENFENRDIIEHAKYLNIKKPSKILNLNINLFSVFSDSITFRVNFYTIKDKLPNKRIHNIILTENIKKGWNLFDLKDFDLKFDKPIFITFEYIPKTKTDEEPCRISGQFLGESIKRVASLGTWSVSKGISMAMYAEIEQ
jgi:hypothetical protein